MTEMRCFGGNQMNVNVLLVLCGLLCLVIAGYEAAGGVMTDLVTDGLCDHRLVYEHPDRIWTSSLTTSGQSFISQAMQDDPAMTRVSGDNIIFDESVSRFSQKEGIKTCIFAQDETIVPGTQFHYHSGGILSGTLISSPDYNNPGWSVNATGLMQTDAFVKDEDALFSDALSLIGTVIGQYRLSGWSDD